MGGLRRHDGRDRDPLLVPSILGGRHPLRGQVARRRRLWQFRDQQQGAPGGDGGFRVAARGVGLARATDAQKSPSGCRGGRRGGRLEDVVEGIVDARHGTSPRCCTSSRRPLPRRTVDTPARRRHQGQMCVSAAPLLVCKLALHCSPSVPPCPCPPPLPPQAFPHNLLTHNRSAHAACSPSGLGLCFPWGFARAPAYLGLWRQMRRPVRTLFLAQLGPIGPQVADGPRMRWLV